ncbi:MAG TPA: YihY/virulence factor BrkB family protein [Bryobacteraceae bacterium]|nr:YihY/virulence factor BrkB family protein [Bryobacteraceae bacterium]
MAGAEPRSVSKKNQNIRRIFRLRFRDFFGLVKESASEWNDDNALRLSASLAFYTLLSLAPLLVVVVAIAAVAFGRKAAEGQLAWEIQGMLGMDQARTIESLILGALQPNRSGIATLISVITLALGASAVVVELQDALNLIWHVPAPQSRSKLGSLAILVKQRFYAFAMVLAAGFLLLVSVISSAWITAMGHSFGPMFPVHETGLHLASFFGSFVVITFLFAAIYKVMPDVDLQWGDVLVGASFTALVFTIGKQLIGWYLGEAGIGSGYGAAGSLVVVLVWVYYSAQLFFFGAEFTKVYANRFGSHFAAKLNP